MISLTIKSGGRLDQLRRRLKAIVTPTGKIIMPKITGMGGLESKIDDIAKQIDYLLPGTTAHFQSKKFELEGLKMARTYDKLRDEIIDYFKRGNKVSQDNLKRDYGATEDEINKGLDSLVDEIVEMMKDVGEGLHKSNTTQTMISDLKDVLANLDKNGARTYEHITKIIRGLREPQKEIEDLFKKHGAIIKPQPGQVKVREFFKTYEAAKGTFPKFLSGEEIEKLLEKKSEDETEKVAIASLKKAHDEGTLVTTSEAWKVIQDLLKFRGDIKKVFTGASQPTKRRPDLQIIKNGEVLESIDSRLKGVDFVEIKNRMTADSDVIREIKDHVGLIGTERYAVVARSFTSEALQALENMNVKAIQVNLGAELKKAKLITGTLTEDVFDKKIDVLKEKIKQLEISDIEKLLEKNTAKVIEAINKLPEEKREMVKGKIEIQKTKDING